MQLRGIINEALRRNGQGLSLSPEKPAQFKIGKKWLSHGDNWQAQDLKKELMMLLSDEEKADFYKRGFSEGVLFESGRRIGFTLSLSHQGICAHFHWLRSESLRFSDWGFPAILLESLKKGQGLSVICGPKASGKTSALLSMAIEAKQQSNMNISLFTDREEYASEINSAIFVSYDADLLLTMNSFSLGSDLILIDSDRTEIQLRALDLVDQGQNVLMTLPATSIESSLQRLKELLAGRSEKLAQSVQWILGLRLLAGIDFTYQPVFELMTATSNVRAGLKQNDWAAVESEMRTTGEATSMRTLNQSLMQMLLKRKVELKVGFDESPNPAELDSLLRKVGF